jgi:hypothetical protein
MQDAPKRFVTRAVQDACRYRDACDTTPVSVQQRFYAKARRSADALCKAMGCVGTEDLLVNKLLCKIVESIPRKILMPGKDY